MEPNDSILSSYYPPPPQQQQQQQHHRTTTSASPTTTTPSGTNGLFSTAPPPNHHQQQQQHYSSDEAPHSFVLSPHSVTGRAPVAPTETVKRKRGRPRKYGTAEAQAPTSGVSSAAAPAVSSSAKRVSSPLPSPPHKKESTSAVSSSKKAQLLALDVVRVETKQLEQCCQMQSSVLYTCMLPWRWRFIHTLHLTISEPLTFLQGNVGQGFTPHIINLAAGEDVSQKIMSFVQQRKCAVCIMSASGSISNASLRQPATLGGNVSYEGRYEILSLSGSFLHAEIGGASSRSGGLSVCLAGTDGKIVGGGVGGPLLAAGPVQVIVGSFFIDTSKDYDKKVEASSSKLPPHVGGASVTSVSYRPSPDTSGRVSFRGNDDAQNYGGNFIAQSRGTYVTSPRSTDWRGVLDARNSGNIDFTDHGAQSPDDGDDEQLGL